MISRKSTIDLFKPISSSYDFCFIGIQNFKSKHMKNLFFLPLIFCLNISQSHSQTSFSLRLYAGSNASWGKSQFLSIDSKGNCFYSLTEVNKGVIDSSSFKISSAQLSKINETITKIKFFKLNKTYNEKSRDGTRLSVEVTSGGKTHTVHWINIHNSESDQMLSKLNAILKAKNISITY